MRYEHLFLDYEIFWRVIRAQRLKPILFGARLLPRSGAGDPQRKVGATKPLRHRASGLRPIFWRAHDTDTLLVRIGEGVYSVAQEPLGLFNAALQIADCVHLAEVDTNGDQGLRDFG